MTDTASLRKTAGFNAAGFFIFWLLVLLAGADKPPPRGFLWVVLIDALCAVVVYWRVPTYIRWRRTRRAGRYGLVILDGLVAGLLVALPLALRGSGEPTLTMDFADYVIWFVIVGLVGGFNSLALYLINRLVVK